MDQMTLELSLYWMQALVFQGKRVLNAEKIEGHITHKTTLMEEQFFLNAIGKALRWIGELKFQSICVQQIDFFLTVASVAKLVRNKREHDDEYFGPPKKTEVMSDASQPGSSLTVSVGQSITVHRDGKVLLGGTVDINEIIEAAKEFATNLRTEQHRYWEGRSLGDRKNIEHFLAPEDLVSR